MPIEIRELHIRVAVDARPPPRGGGGQTPAGEREGDETDKDAIVADCVEQVLQILHAKKER